MYKIVHDKIPKVHSFCYTFLGGITKMNENKRKKEEEKIIKLKQKLLILKTLKMKVNYSELARIYELDRRTIKKYHDGYDGKRKVIKKRSSLDKYKEEIKEKLSLPGATINATYQYFKNKYNDFGTYSKLYKYVKKEKLKPNKTADVTLRFETPYGKQIQFDWKEDIKMISKHGELFKFNVFSATLGASRLHYYVYSKNKTRIDVER